MLYSLVHCCTSVPVYAASTDTRTTLVPKENQGSFIQEPGVVTARNRSVEASATPGAIAWASDEEAAREQVVQMLLTAVDDSNPGVKKSDIIVGYGDGELRFPGCYVCTIVL